MKGINSKYYFNNKLGLINGKRKHVTPENCEKTSWLEILLKKNTKWEES